MANPWMVQRQGPQPNQTHDLTQPVVTIGRDLHNEITIDDAQVSRHHCRLQRDGDEYAIEDLDSLNGTFVNGREVRLPRVLRAGDVISIGESVTLIFGFGGPIEHPTVEGSVMAVFALPVESYRTVLLDEEPMQPSIPAPVDSPPTDFPVAASGEDDDAKPATGPCRATVFVSHAPEDEDFVRRLAGDLQGSRIRSVSRTGLLGRKQAWDPRVDDAMRQADAVLVIVSPAAVDSTWVRRATRLAIDRQQRVLLVGAKPVVLPDWLANLPAINFHNAYTGALQVLIQLL
jgi:predicted component of type VI protein secretion system